MSDEPVWVSVEDALLFHGQLIAGFGGAPGVRDEGLLASALARPKQVFAYESRDLAVLAGTYAHGIVRNHPFVDGNKRVAFTVTRVFLGVNDVAFDPPETEAVVMLEGLASDDLALVEFVAWVRKHSTARPRRRRR